jgi:pimeloyl-ACP methyl ester carboxylesterase
MSRQKTQMVTKVLSAAAVALAGALVCAPSEAAGLAAHPDVAGADIPAIEVRPAAGAWEPVDWDSLEGTRREPGRYEIRLHVDDGAEPRAVRLPVCAGRSRIALDGRDVTSRPGPVVIPIGRGLHDLVIGVDVSPYEARIACGERPRVGVPVDSVDGLGSLFFSSPHASKGGGSGVVFVPPGHDSRKPATLLVGLHPWNGSTWTYAAYAPLLREARARDIVLLMPSGLGNSLYTADAEDEVLRAVDALASSIEIDPRAVSIWGASMGGAGATTIAFHHPDRFASVASFFGDAKYDLRTYVRALLPDEGAAHLVNALDVVDNARHLQVLLVHGEDDRTSPIEQSDILARAMRDRSFTVRFERVAGFGHSGALVARFLPDVAAMAASSRAPAAPSRVTYRSTRPSDSGAYGVQITRTSPRGDAFVDLERDGAEVHVRRAEGVRAIVLKPGALGTPASARPPLVDDTGSLDVRWAAPQ